MSNYTTKIREALESCIVAKDRGMEWLHFDAAKIRDGLSALAELERQPSQTEDLEARAREWWLFCEGQVHPTPANEEETIVVLAAFARSLAHPPAGDLIEAGTRLMERAKKVAGDIQDAQLDDLAENFLTALSAHPPVEDQVEAITLQGEQSDPAGTITVTVQMSSGKEIEAIRTCANSIYHMVTIEGLKAEQLLTNTPGTDGSK